MKRRIIKTRPGEEYDNINKPCFAIDKNNVPRGGGEEYLLNVIEERKKCPETVSCQLDLLKFRKNQNRFAPEIQGLAVAPDSLKPTVEWQNIQVANFSELRMYLAHLIRNKDVWPDLIPHPDPESDPKEWIDYFKTHKPTLRCVMGMTQAVLEVCLELLIKCLDNVPLEEELDYWIGEWIYAVLCCLQLPLLPDTVSLIRNLARKSSVVRSKLLADEERSARIVAPYNIFICLVARYFVQKDLTD